MKTPVILSPRAQRDVEDIADYSLATWANTLARSYIIDIQNALKILSEHPDLGINISYIRPDYHKYPVGSHIIFYRLIATGIDVIRILHQRMDFERHI